jgi:PAS domain S-box-containing protein
MGFRSKPIRPRSIRGQLSVLIAALAVPLVAFQVLWGYEEYRDAEQAAESEALILADATASSVRQFLGLTEQLLVSVADEFGQAWIAADDCGGGPELISDLLPFFVTMTVLRADGRILCSAHPVPEGVDADAWSVTAAVRSSGGFAMGEAVVGEISGQWILPVGVPVFGADGALAALIIGSVPLLELAPLLEGVTLDDEHLVTIATGDRVVIARSHEADTWVGEPLPPGTGFDREIAPGRFVARGPDLLGTSRAWGQVELDNGWIIYVGVPEASVFGPARALLARQVGTTLLIVIAGILLAGLSYRRIARALQELTRGIRKASGDGQAIPLPDATPAEVSTVVEQFNDTLMSQRRAEAAERTARERYQAIFDNAVFGLYVSTLDGRFLQVNPALAAMLGYASREALLEAGPLALYPSAQIREELIERAVGHGSIENWEVDWLRADGDPIAVRLNGRRLDGPGGGASFEMIVQDITDEKRTESELRQTQKMEAIGKLAGGIAHDFNNLLTVIGGNLELIDDDLPAEHPMKGDIEQIREAASRASTLTGQLLAFARRDPRGARPISVNRLLLEMERMLVRLIGEDVELETRLAPVPAVISIDPGELEQILMNLVLNARDALPKGGCVIVETRMAPLGSGGATGRPGEDGVLLSVRDTGVGMDPETTKRVFEPFYTTKPMGEGTGLGLSTVYGIVQRASGHIEIESEPEIGTTVQIWFPLASGEVEVEPRPVVEARVIVGGDERILVVEDEELVRVFVRRALTEAGYQIVVASDGREALEVLEGLDTPVDLVLTDVVMPRMSGTELAQRLLTISPDTPVLFMSGYVQNQSMNTQFGDNPEILLRKPFTTAELCSRVRLMLDRRYAGQGPHSG